MNLDRREFLAAGAALSLGLPSTGLAENDYKMVGRLIASSPMLQNAAATSMGVAFAVSAMANGYVEYSTSPDLANAKKVKCGGFRVTDMNDKVMLVRLTGLKPATRYYYRIGADRISYKGGYAMSVTGSETDPRVYSFVTSGERAPSSFAVINDTHACWPAFDLIGHEVDKLDPSVLVWNGDACNCCETMEEQVDVFLSPKSWRKDYLARLPMLYVPGNHDSRGMANRHIERIVMFRQPEERLPRDWDLGRNFAIRQGDIAMIGLDTAEDKLDDRDVFAGLFVSEPYRIAQTDWLHDALERPEIRTAPYLVAFCHIPLYDADPLSNPGDCDKDGGGRYTEDFAMWQRPCFRMWGPLLAKAGCQLVITAHQHQYRYDAPNDEHSWAQIVGGGPELDEPKSKRYPTVIEGKVENGFLRVVIHDVLNKCIADEHAFKPRYGFRGVRPLPSHVNA